MTANKANIALLLTALLILVLLPGTAWSWQMTAPNNDNNNPVQSGYAVITPGGAGLVVFETFGQIHGNETLQAGVFPANLTTDALLYVSTSGRLSRNLGIAIVNPGTNPATVSMTLRDSSGSTVASMDLSVDAHTQISEFVTQLFSAQNPVPKDLTGTLEISSDIPVAIIGLRFRGVNFSTLPATSLAPSPGSSEAIILPQFATGGGWATEIVLTNTSDADLDVTVDLFGKDGSPLTASLNGTSGSTFSVTIPAHGVVTLAPRNSLGDSAF